MAGVRFVVAGAVLLAWARLRGFPWPGRVEWRNAALVGALLLLGGNGAVVWAEQWIASGLVALLVATAPLWMVLLEWLAAGGERPGPGVIVGIFAGLGGVALLVGSGDLGAGGTLDVIGGVVVVGGSVLWAGGSILARHARLPVSPRMATGAEMLLGGLLLLAAGTLAGEPARLDLGAASPASLLALLYLIVFGSLVAFSAYVWLLGNTTAARASTYAYVNPVVALLLGWSLADEPLTARTVLATVVILSSVALITLRGGRRRGAMRPPPPGEPGAAT